MQRIKRDPREIVGNAREIVGGLNRKVERFRLELGTFMKTVGASNLSKDFLDLVRDIGEASSKAEEERIIEREIRTLREQLAQPESAVRHSI
jgi:hypothetical protein